MSKGLVVITGASSGFGEATAMAFAKLGHPLALGARRVEKLSEVAKACEKAGSPKCAALPLDVTDKASIEAFAKASGTPAVLVNNAGLARGVDPIDKLKDEDVVAMIETNIKGLLRVTRAFLPGMIEAKQGHVINLDSIAGYQVYEGGIVYCMTKHAVRALSQGMRLDVNGKNIRVTDIAPGAADTEFSSVRLGDAEKAKNVYKGYEPLHAADVADAIVWAATRPPHVTIHEILLTCTAQASVTKFFKGG
jgi:3-hydroxy acid dehydrogenase / malonic semialdehyde reductase